MDAMTKYLVSLPDYQNRLVKSMKMTPAERRAQFEKDPKAMAIVKQNSLTSQDYLVGVPALRMALMAAQGLANSPKRHRFPGQCSIRQSESLRAEAEDGCGGRCRWQEVVVMPAQVLLKLAY